MRIAALMLAAYCAAAADGVWTAPLRVAGVEPDLLLLAALVWLVVCGRRYGFVGAGLVMLAGDLLGPGRVGAGAAAMLAAGWGVGALQRRWALGNLPGRIGGVALGAVAWSGAFSLCNWCLGEIGGGLLVALVRAVGAGLYTAALAVPVLMVVGWSDRGPARVPRDALGGTECTPPRSIAG